MPKADTIQVQKIVKGGEVYIDIRRCIKTTSGKPIPTSRGLSIPFDKLDEVLEKAIVTNGTALYIEL